MATATLTGTTDSQTIPTEEGEWYRVVMTLASGSGTLAAQFTGADGATAQAYVDKDGNAISKTANYAFIMLALGPALLLELSGGTAADWRVKAEKITSRNRARV